jgi:hypothetical protein
MSGITYSKESDNKVITGKRIVDDPVEITIEDILQEEKIEYLCLGPVLPLIRLEPVDIICKNNELLVFVPNFNRDRALVYCITFPTVLTVPQIAIEKLRVNKVLT